METNSSYATVKKSPESDRRRRCKQKKNKASEEPWPKTAEDANKNNDPNHVAEQFEIEYLPEKGELDEEEGMDEEFRRIFTKFSFSDVAGSEDIDMNADSDTGSEEEDGVKEKISNKKKKLQRRMKIAELKRICSRPDVIEVWDATASDPKLLVFLKSCRNTVPVPRHWSRKRKFLQGKIGVEKEPFQLPDFVAATGIEKVRLKQKQREPSKLGRMEIDYKVLHDAFFKYQSGRVFSLVC